MRLRKRAPAGTSPPSGTRRRRVVRRGRVAALIALALPLSLTAGLSNSAQAADPACSVDYSANDWGSGFTANVTIHNEGTAALNGWTLTYSYSGNQRLAQGWNGRWSQSGQTVTVVNESFNATIPAGGSTSAGANFTYSGTNTAPTTFSVNGSVCGEEPVEDPAIVAAPTSLALQRGASGTVGLRLNAQPTSNVTVSVARTSGNSDLAISGPATRTFTPTNWNITQSVTIAAGTTGSGSAVFTASAPGHEPATFTVTQLGGGTGDGENEERFLSLYEQIKNPANGYFSPEGVPYHSVETLIVEAPDYGHETTSEAYSYLIWLEAQYGRITEDWGPFNAAWEVMEEYMIPEADEQPTNSFYDPSSPATYAPESTNPGDYPAELDNSIPVGDDPLANELSSTYNTDNIYGMHWLQDVDDIYGYGDACGGTSGEPTFINTFQRGPQESVWETVPQPSCEDFTYGGPNGYLDLFTGDASYAEQWRYTNAPDADARAIQAAYWANQWATEQGNASAIAGTVDKASRMGDYLRYAMYDKYFKRIGNCVGASACPAGTGKNSAHYLLNWYYAWGGALDTSAGWAWRIGSSYAHFGYQNPMAAYALSEDAALVPNSPTADDDWATSLDRQLEFYQWLQSAEGGIAGGATNSWEGHYGTPPAGTPTFYGMFYDEKPVYHDPPSNQWFGMQTWSMQRLAEYYYATNDSRAGTILDKWVEWVLSEVTIGTNGDYAVPATLRWSGAPDTWNASNPGDNSELHVEVTAHSQDVGVTGSLANTLSYYAAASGNTAAQEAAAGLLDALWANSDSKGISVPEPQAHFERFDDEIYIPPGWSGTMPNGDVIEPGATFESIRTFYHDDPNWGQVEDYLNGGPVPVMEYHRFWAQADIAIAMATYSNLFEV
ncbi:glycoside hydrolase family 48 protein [Streptomyces litchfieldiae]|uniref:Glycoside hydrolase family 48 protein n=1 Tax=Streptomyces litchfieldiae TaxID=3075543 RepID=A0ABU2MJL9_9ACTN|nr:glycoside hydrolase family 48 protein [Streptomyces sp. DSM 44938]MDT0341685.1 glycoside hydrolase family 48 protein [Streptomyces sp. DSM 44938]